MQEQWQVEEFFRGVPWDVIILKRGVTVVMMVRHKGGAWSPIESVCKMATWGDMKDAVETAGRVP